MRHSGAFVVAGVLAMLGMAPAPAQAQDTRPTKSTQSTRPSQSTRPTSRLSPLEQKARRKKAQRLVTFLELPARRRDAVHGLLGLGSAGAPALGRKLNDPRRDVVFRCVHVLRLLGEDAAPALPQLRALARSEDNALAAAARWAMVGVPGQGRIVAADNTKGCVVELDVNGKILRTLKIPTVYDAQPLGNGRYLACVYSQGKVVEIDAKGKEYWKYDGCKTPLAAERLPNGNTLVTGAKSKYVREIDPKGRVVWEFKSPWPNDADRLPCGNTLISDYQARKLVEVDARGKVVWKLDTPKGTTDVQRLANGNTLFVLHDAKLVREVDLSGKTVWECRAMAEPKTAMRLRNGHTIIGGSKKIVAVDARGKQLWAVDSVSSVHALWTY